MSVFKYDADDLIESVRNYGMIPDANSQGTQDSDILRYLNETLRTVLLPAIMTVRENFGEVTERTDLAASTSRYPMPARAAFDKLRALEWVNANGKRRALTRTTIELRSRFGQTPSSTPKAYSLEGNRIVIYPSLDSTPEGELELVYTMRASQIVPTDEVAIIDDVDLVTGEIHIESTPTAFAAGLEYDIHSPKSGAELRIWDEIPTSYNSVTQILTFPVATIDGSVHGRYVPAVGDYVCLSGECAIPFLPKELHPILAKGAAVRVLRAAGDHESADKVKADFLEELQTAITMLDDRVEGDPEAVVNPTSFLNEGPIYPYWSDTP